MSLPVQATLNTLPDRPKETHEPSAGVDSRIADGISQIIKVYAGRNIRPETWKSQFTIWFFPEFS
jgi:hypothetical protein